MKIQKLKSTEISKEILQKYFSTVLDDHVFPRFEFQKYDNDEWSNDDERISHAINHPEEWDNDFGIFFRMNGKLFVLSFDIDGEAFAYNLDDMKELSYSVAEKLSMKV